MSSANADAVETLARTLWGEARGEGPDGMQAVAAVVLNRQAHRRWPNDVVAVCQQPWQFSCWNPGDPNRSKLLAVTAKDAMFARALGIARDALAGELVDPTGGADHYHAKGILPSWAKGQTPSAAIGNHLFYKLG